jgi:hypothetical protein
VAGQQQYQYVTSGTEEVIPQDGVWVGGTEVRNVFPYDAQGNPLTDVQLFDENGRPISVGTSARTPLQLQNSTDGNQYTGQVPAVDANNRPAWNVYPLRQQELRLSERVDPVTGNTIYDPASPPTPASAPLQTTLPVRPPQAAASPSPSAAPSASPAASASSAPSAQVSPSAVPSTSRS